MLPLGHATEGHKGDLWVRVGFGNIDKGLKSDDPKTIPEQSINH